MKINLASSEKFRNRHISPSENELQEMLNTIGVDSLDTLIDETIPSTIRLKQPLQLPKPLSENLFLKSFKATIGKTKFLNLILA